jgi:hypothetical protein
MNPPGLITSGSEEVWLGIDNGGMWTTPTMRPKRGLFHLRMPTGS